MCDQGSFEAKTVILFLLAIAWFFGSCIFQTHNSNAPFYTFYVIQWLGNREKSWHLVKTNYNIKSGKKKSEVRVVQCMCKYMCIHIHTQAYTHRSLFFLLLTDVPYSACILKK